ncbi:unnamed protein product, partial [Cylindrotheca closterium]
MAKETLLHYPDFNKPFEIHTDASKYQIGAVITQDSKPIAFYSRKLRDGQHNYTTTERELLAIVETLKEFQTILLGHKIKVYTDHKNLTLTQFNTERVLRWHMVLEEYGPEHIYIKGPDNIVADALSRLDLIDEEDDDSSPSSPTLKIMAHNDGERSSEPSIPKTKNALKADDVTLNDYMNIRRDELPDDIYPLCMSLISAEQQKESELQAALNKPNSQYTRTEVRGGNTRYDIIYQNEVIPWDTLCIDLIGPYVIKEQGKRKWELHCLTMIDPATGWFKIAEIPDKRADTVSNKLEQTWLVRYPWPQHVILDRGSEFMAEVHEMLKNDYGCTVNQTTTRNPQANAIVERVHQIIGNMIRTFFVDDTELGEKDPYTGILSAVALATRATIYTTLNTTPSQLVFGRDAMLDIEFHADWNAIKNRKQKRINENNLQENAKRILHNYQVGDQINGYAGLRMTAKMATVQKNKEGFTPRQVKAAMEARSAMHILNAPSTKSLKYAIRSGLIKNFPITEEAINHAKAIFGPDASTLKGKSTRPTPKKTHNDFFSPPEELYQHNRTITVCIDHMEIGDAKFLTCIDTT